MNIVCVICSDLLVPSDDIFHTPCGHIFHFVCLIRWFDRSKTCPQCRERTTEHKIHRIFFNFSNNDSIVEDSSTLQQKIDNLNFQLKLRDKSISDLTAAKLTLEKQTVGLRHEVRRVESEINGKNSAIHALKEQTKFYKQQCVDVDNHKKEIEQLKKDIEKLKNLQTLMDAATDEVDKMFTMTPDPSTLVTYISVMKRELTVSFKKRRELRDKIKNLQQELMQVSTKNKFLSEEHIKRKELEEQLMICESKKISLQTQLLDIQASAQNCVCNKVTAEELDNSKINKEYNFEKESNTAIDECIELDDIPKVDKNDSCTIIETDNIKNTQSAKSQGFFSMKDHGLKRANSSLKVPSILAKKSKFSQPNQKTVSDSGMTFDGFGGHAKYDKFPSLISSSHVKKVREETKTKRPKLDIGDNQKLNLLNVLSDTAKIV